MSLVSNSLSIYCALNYKWSPIIRLQLSKRFPLFYPFDDNSVPISSGILLGDLLQLLVSVLVLRQLISYRGTKNVHQGISLICITVIGMICCFGIFTYTCSYHNLPISDSGRFGIFYLEHVNYLWIAGNVTESMKYFPQLSLNWMGLNTRGVSSRFVFISLVAELLNLIGTAALPNNFEFYARPFNLAPRPVMLIKVCCLLGMLYQGQSLYLDKKPYLPRGK